MEIRYGLKFLLLFTILQASKCVTETVVNTTVGKIAGLSTRVDMLGKQYMVTKFLGIPYGEDTSGSNRFRRPVPKAPFNDTFYAYTLSTPCMQAILRGNPFNRTEDCLRLNIFVPRDFQSLSSTEKLPVMIWLHGGAFVQGAAKGYNSEILASFGGVIVVTLDFRLAEFGFLNVGDDRAKGNMALWDQHLAFKWVKSNIEEFHGNADNITIFGESSGATMVGLHTLYAGNKVRGLEIETEEDIDDSIVEFNHRETDAREADEETGDREESNDDDVNTSVSTSVSDDRSQGRMTTLEVLPKVPSKTDYLFEEKIIGRAMEVHINNLVEPKDCRKVRELDTKHVNYLEESFLSAPGANFNLLAGNLIKGSREDVRKEGGAVIEAIGGNHTRAALKLLFAKGFGEETVLVTIYNNLTDMEALKIGTHHNLVAERSKEMSFVDKVGIVKKVVDTDPPNLYKTLEGIFGAKDKTQAKNRFKFHVKLAKMPKDIFDLVMEIGQNWSGKKEFNQVTVRGCFYLPDKEIREALLKLRDIGEAAFKEYVDLKMEKKKTSKKQQQQQQPSTDWEKKYEDLKQKYQSLEEEMTALKEENEVLKNKVQVLKDTAEKKSEETTENTPEGKTTQMKKRIRGPVKEVATNKKARTENEKGQFKVGDKVWARFKKDGIMYPAQITANKDNRYDVIFDEDQEEQTCTAEEMKLLKAL